VRFFFHAAAFGGLLAAVALVGTRTGLAQEGDHGEGQGIWRSCSSCHCVPDLRIPEDEDWLRLNETTTCISGEKDTPASRRALIAYLSAEETFRPLLIDEEHEAPARVACGSIRVPATAGSAYLRAERRSVRMGSPPKVRLRWQASDEGKTLSVPIGQYRVVSYSFYRRDGKGGRWAASGSSAEGCAPLTIGADAEATLDLLPEIQAHLSAQPGEAGSVFGFFMTNRKGQRMSLARNGRLVDPTWVVAGPGGAQVDAGAFEVT